MYETSAQTITTRAFLPVPMSQRNFLKTSFEILTSFSASNKKPDSIAKFRFWSLLLLQLAFFTYSRLVGTSFTRVKVHGGFTFRVNRIRMQQQDRTRSGILVRPMLLPNSLQISMKLSPRIFKPSKLLIWLQAIIRLAAEVNPDITGMETNSTKNPRRSIPRAIVMHPDKKHRRTAYSGMPLRKTETRENE